MATPAHWLDHARKALADAFGPKSVAGVVLVTVRGDGGHSLTFELPPESRAESSPWSPMHRAILQALREANKPLPAEVLARKAGYKCHSGFRQCLTELDRANLIRRTPDGYVGLAEGEDSADEPEETND